VPKCRHARRRNLPASNGAADSQKKSPWKRTPGKITRTSPLQPEIAIPVAITPTGEISGLIHRLPSIVLILFLVLLLAGAMFEFRRMIGGRVLGSFLLGTCQRRDASSVSSFFMASPVRRRSPSR
jgi:hypothetical protein